ncbi:MAG: RDD family protein [Dokdonella sp.]
MDTNAAWYYADTNHKRQGPLTRAALVEAIDRGAVNAATLVWRSGPAAWQPLASLSDELSPRAGALAPAPHAGDPYRVTPLAAGDIVYAGFLKRWAALIIDGLVLGLPLLAVTIVLGAAIGLGSGGGERVAVAQGIGYLLWLIATPLYYAGQETSRHQATLGKRAIGIKVTDLAGRRLAFGRALARWFAAALSYLTFYVGFLMAGFTGRKQALHDYVAGTLVVDRWAWSEHPERQRPGLGGGVIVLAIVPFVFIAIVGVLAAIALPAYQNYTLRAKVADALIQGHALQTTVAEALTESERCPRNGEAGIATAQSYASGVVAGITALQRADGRCGLDIELHAAGQSMLDGRTIQLSFDRQSRHWRCRSDLAPAILGALCDADGAGSATIAP